MKFSPARKICAVVLSAASLFYLAGLIPSPQVSGAVSNLTPVTSIVKPVNDAHIHHYVKPALFRVPAVYRTFGPGTSYPDASDPTRKLSVADQITFACIRRYESRNHRVDGAGSEGWYQFTIATWNLARPFITNLAPTPNQASGNQQSQVAVWYFLRNGRFGVEWAADASECPGKF